MTTPPPYGADHLLGLLRGYRCSDCPSSRPLVNYDPAEHLWWINIRHAADCRNPTSVAIPADIIRAILNNTQEN